MIENDVEDIGALLKAQREKLGYSLQDVAKKTCIRRTYLESIENNKFSDLPGRAYVVGFVKAYARYLGRDIDPLLVQLDEILLSDAPQSLKPMSPVIQHQGRLSKSSAGAGLGRLLFWAIVIIVLGAVIFFLVPKIREKGPAETVSSQPVPVKMVEKEPVKVTDNGSEKGPVQESVNVNGHAKAESAVKTTPANQEVVIPSQKE